MKQYAFAIPLRFGAVRLREITPSGVAKDGPEEYTGRETNGLQDEQRSSVRNRKNVVSIRGSRARK